MIRLLSLSALVLLSTLTACGGGEESDCTPQSVYQALVDNGTLTPRPALKPTDTWSDPWVVGVTTGFPGGPPQISGPYYVPGETPAYVCD